MAHPIRRRRPGRGNEVQGFPSLNKCLLNANVGGEQKQVVRVVRNIHKHPFQSINAFCLMLNTQCMLIHDGQAQCAEYGPGVMSKCKRTVLYCAISDHLKEVVCYGSVMEYDKKWRRTNGYRRSSERSPRRHDSGLLLMRSTSMKWRSRFGLVVTAELCSAV